MRETRHPAIPDPTPHNQLDVLIALKQSLEIGRKDRRGDPLDRWVTIRDLVDGKIASFYDASSVRAGGVGPGGYPGANDLGIGGPPHPGSQFLQPFDPNKLRNLPPRPQNVRTAGLWDAIMVKWDWPDVAGQDVDWLGAVIWVSATNQFSEGALAGYSRSNFWVHENVGLGSGGTVGVRYYWVAWFAQSDPDAGTIEYPWGSIPGIGRQTEWTPYHYELGIRGQTTIDPTYVLNSLKGQIKEAHIFSSLNTRINLIDYDDQGNQYTDSLQSRILFSTRQGVESVYAAIAETASGTLVDGVLTGEYNVRIDLNGYIVGFGLSALADIDGNSTVGTTSTFIIKAENFAIVFPKSGPDDVIIPFIVGTVDGQTTVGIDGRLVVDGSIVARSIEAETIGVREINAVEIAAKLATFDTIITGSLRTSVKPAVRLEINGRGSSETFPLWFGFGEVGNTTIPGYSEPAFFFNSDGSLTLAGDLTVTGIGQFFVGNNVDGEWRLQLGSFEDNTLLYVGADSPIDLSDAANWIFYIDKSGNARFRGTVEAEFVSGEISRTNVIGEYDTIVGTNSVSNNTAGSFPWTELGTWMLPASPFQPHLPTLNLNVSFFGTGVQAAIWRILWSNGNVNNMQELVRGVVDMFHYGGFFPLQAVAKQKTSSISYFRLEFSGFDNQGAPTSSSRIGYTFGIR